MANRMLLDTYIQSYGVELPKDWTHYQVGHEHESLCVLCHEQHSYIELFTYKPDNLNHRKGTGTYVCDDCQLGVENSLLRIHYPEFVEQNLREQGVEELGYLGKVAIEVRDRRVSQFNTLYEFDNSVKLRYNHLHSSRDVYVKPEDINKCYFCEIDIITSSSLKIKVPVQHCDELTGGIIKCCSDCTLLLDKELLRADLHAILNHQAAKCTNCKVHYWITAEEAVFRNVSRSSHRVCPECAYEAVTRIQMPINIFYVKENMAPRKSPMIRFKSCRCDYCMNNFTLDLSVLLESSFKHVINDRNVCLECRILYPKYLVNGVFVYKHSKNIWAIIHSTQGEWAYTIVKLHHVNNSILELLTTTEENRIETLPEAVSLASERCYEIVEGKQFMLWENEV